MGHTADALKILERFGLNDIVNALLYENGVDSPRNLITMLPTHHTQFDRLRIWFEETEVRFGSARRLMLICLQTVYAD